MSSRASATKTFTEEQSDMLLQSIGGFIQKHGEFPRDAARSEAILARIRDSLRDLKDSQEPPVNDTVTDEDFRRRLRLLSD